MTKPLPHRPARRLLNETAVALGSTCQVVSVGIDLTDSQELVSLILNGGSSFLDDTWTRAEQTDVGLDHRRLAGRWAVKEAVMKALGAGLGELAPIDIEVRTRKSGELYVVLHRSAKRAARSRGIAKWHASLSYGGNWALGLAVGACDASQTARERGPVATITKRGRSIAS